MAISASEHGTVHLVEYGGHGGSYHHTLEVARGLVEAGARVRIHTATDFAEPAPPGAELCPCVRWHRGVEPRPIRGLLIVASFAFVTIPHLVRAVGPDDVAHVQGLFLHPLMLLSMALLRLRARVLVHTPHNTFIRYPVPLGLTWLKLSVKTADTTVVFSEHDARRIASWGGTPVVSPLAMYLPPFEEGAVERWRERWRGQGAREVVLFAGQIRRDKRLDLLIEAAADWPPYRRLAVVGEDKGEADACRRLAEKLGVGADWEIGFVPLSDFAAAIGAADLVVCPYEVGSQSAILSIARELGVRSVATEVGGLGEIADEAVPPGDVRALADAIDRALRSPPLGDAVGNTGPAAEAHLRAYGVAA